MDVTNTHAKDHGQWSLGLKVGVETDGQMDGGDCITFRAKLVGKNELIFSPLDQDIK